MGKEKKPDERAETKPKPQNTTFKYSNHGKEYLQESIVISGHSTFLRYENSTFKTSDEIDLPSRILRPPNPEECPYEPYEFSNIEEVHEYEKRAKRIESFGLLFEMALSVSYEI